MSDDNVKDFLEEVIVISLEDAAREEYPKGAEIVEVNEHRFYVEQESGTLLDVDTGEPIYEVFDMDAYKPLNFHDNEDDLPF